MTFEDDKKTLLDVLKFIRTFIGELVDNHITEDKALFESAWSLEVRPHLDSLITQFNALSSGETPLWRAVQDRGLTGEQLKLKRARLVAVSAKGITKRILDIINTILGSLPWAEPIKEFKEFAEEAMDDPNVSVAAKFV